MNGSENGYAAALFFALMSLGALIKLEDVIGWACGAGLAILAAICLRTALIKSAQSDEENHQRIEIQFQQLRQKINEGYSATTHAMNAITDTSETLQTDLQEIRSKLSSPV